MPGLITLFNTSPIKQHIDTDAPFDAEVTRGTLSLSRFIDINLISSVRLNRLFYIPINVIFTSITKIKLRLYRFITWSITSPRTKDDPPESTARKWRP